MQRRNEKTRTASRVSVIWFNKQYQYSSFLTYGLLKYVIFQVKRPISSVLDNIYLSRFIWPMNPGRQDQDSESLLHKSFTLICLIIANLSFI